MTPDMKLEEPEIRAKVIELLERMDTNRLNMWIISGAYSGVVDPDLVEKCMLEEIPLRSQEVQDFWEAPCDICPPEDQCPTHDRCTD